MTLAAFSRREFIAGSTAAAALLLSGRSFAQPTDPTDLSIADAYPLIRAGRLSPVELVEAYLDRIRRSPCRVTTQHVEGPRSFDMRTRILRSLAASLEVDPIGWTADRRC